MILTNQEAIQLIECCIFTRSLIPEKKKQEPSTVQLQGVGWEEGEREEEWVLRSAGGAQGNKR